MAEQYSVTLARLMDIHSLVPVYLPESPDDIKITVNEVTRPGLQITGFFDYFDNRRIQVMGRSEFAYLTKLEPEDLKACMDQFFAHKPVALIIARNIPIPDEMMEAARLNGSAILQTEFETSEFVSALINTLNVELAPRTTRHGVLVEVYGEGVLMLGESGVGKSETAMELVKRGHRLIADDAVEIRRVSTRTLVGTSPDNIRHFMELRGIGIINVRDLFGIGAVKLTQGIDIIVQLENWDQSKVYDRMGLENEYSEILGIEIATITIPVKPGRNLAMIIEVAAMNHRQKLMGHNSAKELLERLGMLEPQQNEKKDPYDGWSPTTSIAGKHQ